MAEVRSRSDVASAAGLVFAATLIILIDVRVPDLDIVADAIGGVLVVVAALRIHGAISGADLLRTALVVLAVIALPVTILETLTSATDALGPPDRAPVVPSAAPSSVGRLPYLPARSSVARLALAPVPVPATSSGKGPRATWTTM
jgi:hypothetical protein